MLKLRKERQMYMNASEFENSILSAGNILNQMIALVKDDADLYQAHEIEEILHHKCLQLGQHFLKGYFLNISNNDVGAKIENNNGVTFKRCNIVTKDYFSVFGKITVPRRSYRKEGFDSIFPLDHQCNMPPKTYSFYLQDIMNSLSVQNTFSESRNILQKALHIDIYERPLEDLTKSSSYYYDEFYQGKDVSQLDNEGEIQVASFDGKGVPMIKKEAAKITGRQGKGEKRQKKKEALVGVSYTVDRNIRTAEEIAANLIYPEKNKDKSCNNQTPKAKNIRRMASLIKPKAEVVKEIEKDAFERNRQSIRDNVVLIDGMPSLQKLVEKNFVNITDYTIILDIIHVLEYLYVAAHVFFKESSPPAKDYVYKQLMKILNGKVGRVIGGIKQSATKKGITGAKLLALEKVVKYLTNHKSIMKYDRYLKKGYPIGTGVVESTCKSLVKERMEGSGKRWSLEGAEAMLKLRSIKGSNDWEEYHKFYIKREALNKQNMFQFTLKKAG